MPNIIKKTEKTNIILQSFLCKIISEDSDVIKKSELNHLLKYVDYNKLPDRVIADNDYMHDMILWESMDRMKIVRIIARNANTIKYIDLSKYNYKIREVKNMLRIRPFLIDRLNFNLNTICHKDAFELLTIGIDEISEKINIRNFNFTSKESYEIIAFNDFEQTIVEQFNLKKLKDYHVADILIYTGIKYLNMVDINVLTARRWVEVLRERKELFEFCNLEKFKESDIYNSVELICLFPNENIDFIIKDRDFKQELSAFGWQKLIIAKPDEYVNCCCYWKLNDANWRNITFQHPNLIAYKP